MPLSQSQPATPIPDRGPHTFFAIGMVLAGVNLIWVTMLAISVLRLVDNPLYLRSIAVISGIAAVALALRLIRRTSLAVIVIGLQFVIAVALLTDGLDGVAY